eukprot:2566479-Rhodomonas_salina.3
MYPSTPRRHAGISERSVPLQVLALPSCVAAPGGRCDRRWSRLQEGRPPAHPPRWPEVTSKGSQAEQRQRSARKSEREHGGEDMSSLTKRRPRC